MSRITVNKDLATSKVGAKVIAENNLPPPDKTPPEDIPAVPEDQADEKKWNLVIKGLLYGLTFLLPILFTPWTFEPLEFSKQLLLFVLTIAALGAWLVKVLVTRTFRFVQTPLDLPIAAFLVIYLLASVFSVDRVASFLGFYGSFHGNFFQVLFLVAFYYLIVNNFQSVRDVKRLVGIFLFSSFLTLLFVVVQFFGWYIFPFPITKNTSFNTIGGLLAITVFSTFTLIMHLGFKQSSWYTPWGGRLWRAAAILAGLVVLLTVNFIYAWVGLLVGLLIYMIFELGFSRKFSMKNFVGPLVLLVAVVALLISQWVFRTVPLRNLFNFDLPLEVRLDYKTAAPVLKGVVAEKPVLGSGPNTFMYAFSKHREKSFNQSPFWAERFGRAPSEAAEYLVGTGVLGLLAFEILSLIFLAYGIYFLLHKKDEESWNLGLALLSSFTVLWFIHWVFFFNTVMAFSFWLIVGSFLAVTRIVGGETVKTTSFSFATSPRRTVSVVSVVSLALVLMIVFLFFASAVYAADIFYRKGVDQAQKPETHDLAQRNFEKALRLNRFRPDYYLGYGEFLFLRINQELAKNDRNVRLIENWLAAGINTARRAVDLSPTNWTAWERLANLYTSARPLVAGVDRFIIDALTKATEADPHNPILFVELGQVNRLASRKLDVAIVGTGVDSDGDGLYDDREEELGSDPDDPDSNGNGILDGAEVLSGLHPAQTGALSDAFLARYIKTDAGSLVKAGEAFRKAIALKEDYVAAYYQLALILSQQGKYSEAATELERAVQLAPRDVNLRLELGAAYFNAGRSEEAATQFQFVVNSVPNHANARFYLALTLERLGNFKKALNEYRKIFETNPDNELLKTKITDLEQKVKQPANGKKLP